MKSLEETSCSISAVLRWRNSPTFRHMSGFTLQRCASFVGGVLIASLCRLFAATEQAAPVVGNVHIEPEPFTKNVEVQTTFRESESQTDPYTPEHTVPKGGNPEVLVLSNLGHANGLPVGPRELYMIAHARRKRDLELSLPPFTDAASLALRQKLMEQQERREFELREAELDGQRTLKLQAVAAALQARNETAVFLAEQKLEALRQTRMEKRATALERIKAKRLKVLRSLVQQRDKTEPKLNDTVKTDMIDKYFDKTSELYAPLKRSGSLKKRTTQLPSFAQTAHQSIERLQWLERTMTTLSSNTFTADHLDGTGRGIRRSNAQQKREQAMQNDLAKMFKASRQSKISEQDSLSDHRSPILEIVSPLATASTTHKGRPSTPDFVHVFKAPPVDRLSEAVCLLQRLLRGRAAQNIMMDGRNRRLELIRELQYTPPPPPYARSAPFPAEILTSAGVEVDDPPAEKESAVLARMVTVQTIAVDAVICSYISRRLAELCIAAQTPPSSSDPEATIDEVAAEAVSPGRIARNFVDGVITAVTRSLEPTV